MKREELCKMIKIGVKQSQIRRMNNKEYIGVNSPYGYILEKNQLKEDKRCSHIVYLIFDLYDKGISHTQIANYLNERGIVIPSIYKKTKIYISNIKEDSDEVWTKSSVRKILLNKIYNGYYKYSDQKTHKAIIDDELWNRVQYRLKNMQNSRTKDLYSRNGNEFHGKVYCACCGLRFNLEHSICKGGPVKYLRCGSIDLRKESHFKCENNISIKYDDLKDIVGLFMDEEIFSKININHLEADYFKNIQTESLINRRNYIKQEKYYLQKYIKELKDNLLDKIKYIYEEKVSLIKLIEERIEELEIIQKNIYSFARTKEITKNEKIIDFCLIEEFIDKIIVGKLENNNRIIEIFLK